jgi:hypothetical protein
MLSKLNLSEQFIFYFNSKIRILEVICIIRKTESTSSSKMIRF